VDNEKEKEYQEALLLALERLEEIGKFTMGAWSSGSTIEAIDNIRKKYSF